MAPSPPMTDRCTVDFALVPRRLSSHTSDRSCHEESHPWNQVSQGADEWNFPDRNVGDLDFSIDSSFDADGATTHFENCSGGLTWGLHHSDYLDFDDVTKDQDFGVSGLNVQSFRSLFDCGHDGNVEDDGDLTNLCSTQNVFTVQDTTGYLNGDDISFDTLIQDQDYSLSHTIGRPNELSQPLPSQSALGYTHSKLTERQRRPQIVRDWLSLHASWPYPTPAEKSELVAATGYTERQLNNCLSNLRTREKHLFDGHAHEGNGGNGTCSQPRDATSACLDDVQSISITCADDMSPFSSISLPAMNMNDSSQGPSPFDADDLTPESTPNVATELYQDFRTDSAYQTMRSISAPRNTTTPKRKGRRVRAHTHQVGVVENMSDTMPTHTAYPRLGKPGNRFLCTVIGCYESFKNASDWKRHEAGVHGYSDRQWICMLTEAFKTRSVCVFCSEAMESSHHLTKHAIAPCAEKCTVERTFFRKDLLKQHVLQIHLAGESVSVRKNFTVPHEWLKEVDLSAHEPNSCWCGFCRRTFESVATRMDHVAKHFCGGRDMATWVRI